jgi:oxygen-independent coproporphyrinogen III oxidase
MERVSRYICYPSVVHFVPEVGADRYEAWISALEPGSAIGIYLHVPFCERLCWFCACRTQAAVSVAQVSSYVESVLHEIRRMAARLPVGVVVRKMHWAGGSPMVLSLSDIARLGRELRTRLNVTPDAEFAVEIDARRADPDRIEALISAGMTRATLFVPDLDPRVQLAIGRVQEERDAALTVRHLRAGGVRTVGIDILYGLPRQGLSQVERTVAQVIGMEPDRIALQGYAHVPWMARRQRMIEEGDLPDSGARVEQYRAAAAALRGAGYRSVGVEHFAREGDPLLHLAETGRLRHRHLAFTDDSIEAVIGLGASAISSFRQGRVQNAQRTLDYRAGIRAGLPAAQQGWVFSLEDQVRGRAIEMLMCDFRVDMAQLRREFGDFAAIVTPGLESAIRQFTGVACSDGEGGLSIPSDGPMFARLVARCLDPTYVLGQRFSYAI